VSIHDVDMDEVGMLTHELDLLGQTGEVADRMDAQLGHGAILGGVVRPRKAATNIASQPCACGQSRTRSAGPSGPAISMGSSPGTRRRIASQAASVSARGNVQTL
jgi:hypothetical protein